MGRFCWAGPGLTIRLGSCGLRVRIGPIRSRPPVPDFEPHNRVPMATSANRVGIVIVTYNGWQHTRACLDSLRAVQRSHDIVVVDNGSSDDTPGRARREFPEASVLELGSNTGFTGGSNAGIRWCLERGLPYVLLLNNDTEVEPDFLEPMLRQAGTGAVVTPQVRDIARRDQPVRVALAFSFRLGRLTSEALRENEVSRLVEMASGCCLLVPAGVFERVGLFDERFFLYYEDTDFILRARNAGIPVILETRAVIYHHERGSSGTATMAPMVVYYNTRNRLLLMRKHGRVSAGFVCRFAVTRMIYVLDHLVRGHPAQLRAMALGLKDFMRGRFGRTPAW